MSKYPQYQDYVIRDGKLIGEFEQMYADFEDPWEQSTREEKSIEKLIGLHLLAKNKHTRPLEYGCGLGHYTQRLFEVCCNGGGVDISTTAIMKAKTKYPSPQFFVGDLLDKAILQEFKPDCLLMMEITWYILEKLADFKKIIKEYPGLGFYHTLMTYKEDEQRYGREYFTNLNQILEFWSDVINISDWGYIGRNNYDGGARTFLYGKIK